MSKETFKKAIELANSGNRFPVISLVRSDPGLAAVISKLTTPVHPAQYDNSGNRAAAEPDYMSFRNISHETAQNITDAETVMQILPDMELSAQILVSSIISPKDMSTTEINYSVVDGLMAPDVTAALIARTKKHFEEVYKIEPLLSKMLRDILFETGSYAVAVIPENSIDELINSNRSITMESLSESINPLDGSVKSSGILGPVTRTIPTSERLRPGLSMESLRDSALDHPVDGAVRFENDFGKPVDDSFVTVTDNPDVLKIPRINQKIREQRILKKVGTKAMESFTGKLTDREIAGLVYKDRQFNYKAISTLKTQEQLSRRTVGNPLVLHLPSESVIPVYVPGCVEEQVGFFVLLDSEGNPVSKAANIDYYQQLSSRMNQNGSFPSAMLNKVQNMTTGFDLRNHDHLDYATRTYSEMVERDLLARLRNGVYGNGVALAKKEEIYRIMLSRALAKQHSQLLFLPVELMTYMALRYNDNGTGRSLLDEMKILNSLRAMLTFSNVMASLRNSIGRTNVNFKLDENDPDPRKTIEMGIHEISRSRQQYFPLGTNSPTDLVDWIQRAGYQFTWEGHPGMPDVKTEFTETNTNYVKPDSELEESLRKRAIMATGLSPENVDAAFQAEFATQVVSNNLLLAKRVIQIQEQFMPQLSSHLRKMMMNSEELINDLVEILDNNFDKLKIDDKDLEVAAHQVTTSADANIQNIDQQLQRETLVNQFLNEYIRNFEATLPKPNSVTLENQLAALEVYTKALDQTLDAWISESFFTSDVAGNVANQVSTVKAMLRAYYLRQWMTDNGVMPELNELTTMDADGKPKVHLYDIQKDHIEALTKSLTDLMVGLQPVKNAADKVLEAEVGNMDSTASQPATDDTGSGSDEFGTDFGSGSGDVDNLLDSGTDEETSGSETPTGDSTIETPPSGTDTGEAGNTEEPNTKKSDESTGEEGTASE